MHLLDTLPRMRRAYITDLSTDLSDAEWAYLDANLPAPQPYGRPLIHSPPKILKSVFYLLEAGVPSGSCPTTSSLENCPSLLQDVTYRPHFGAAKHGTARALAGTAGKKPAAQRWDGRLTVGQNDRSRWRSTGIRWREKGSRQEASPLGRYGRVDSERRSIAPRSRIRTGSSCCWRPHVIVFRAFLACGWTQVTEVGARDGHKRR